MPAKAKPKGKCATPRCRRQAHSRGLCTRCYQRLYYKTKIQTKGSTLRIRPKVPATELERRLAALRRFFAGES